MSRNFHEEKQFGRLVGAVFLGLGGWSAWRQSWPIAGPAVAGLGLLLIICGFLAPQVLVRPRRAWMALAEVLSFVSTRLILGVVFFIVLTPIAIVMRLRGLDPLRRRRPAAASSWYPYPGRQHDPKHFEKMY